MFFFLSKTLNYLVMPLTIIFVCFLASVLIRNLTWKKRMFWSGLILLFFFSNDFIANEAMRAWEIEARPFNSLPQYKLAIVLTGATISGLTPDDRVYFQRGADRVVHTVQLYKLGLAEKILISGGSGRLVDTGEREADEFREAMIIMGVPAEAIIIENATRNTHESAVEVKKMLDSMNVTSDSCLLVTSAFHMRRSLACYRKVGLKLEAFTTDFYSHPRVFYLDTFLIPKVDAMSIWHKLIREWVGFIAYKIAGYV
jgi:uncharacterized SAM-binding protein YcdF (DUF218 family)